MNCLHCQAELSEAELQAGACAACGHVIEGAADSTDNRQTIADEQLLDSDGEAAASHPGSEVPDDLSESTDQAANIEQTIDDSVELPGPLPSNINATVDSSAGSQTIDSTSKLDITEAEDPQGADTEVADTESAGTAENIEQTIDDSVELPGPLPSNISATVDSSAGSQTIDSTSKLNITEAEDPQGADTEAADTESAGTAENIEQTIDDSVELPRPLPNNINATVDASAGSQTIDSTTEPDQGSGNIEQTIDDSVEVPDSIVPDVKATVDGQVGMGTVDGVDGADEAIGKTVDSVDLDGKPPGSGTVDDRIGSQTIDASAIPADAAIDQTLDSTDIDDRPPGTGTVSDRTGSATIDASSIPTGGAIDQTIDSTDIDDKPPGTGTVSDRTGSATIDASSLPTDGAIDQTIDSADIDDLAAKVDKGTVSERSITRTVDGGTGTEEGTTPERAPAQTVDSTSLDDPSTPDTARSRQVQATYDSAQVSSNEARAMNQMWGGAATDKASPRMTIKGNEPPGKGTGRTTLVIQRRAFRDADAAKTSDSGADYDLLKKLGEGGMGVVYMARQASIDRTVAIKMLKPNISEDQLQKGKFLSEAVITGDLEHPNIVPIYDLGKNDVGALFYAMKRVKGTPWDDAIKTNTITENLEILMKTCDAVAFAHSRGIIHRDLKPENTMLGDFGEVLVMDWGLALPFGKFEKSRSITTQAGMGGTPAYMAPEMATGPFDKMGPPSDIYLLGAILYEIVTGRPPHTGKDVMKCLFAAAKNEIVPTEKTGELIEIALTAMSTRIEDRYASVVAFQDALRSYQEHSESISMSTRAHEQLEEAAQSNEYEDFSRAVFGFQEALNLWDGNNRAKRGVGKAKLAYAESAFLKEDFDLGASLLDADDPAHVELANKIAAGQADRIARQRRLKLAMRAVAAMVATVFVVVSIALFFVNQARTEAIVQKGIAEEQKEFADEQRGVAEEQRGLAESAQIVAEQNEKIAVANKEEAERQRMEADLQRMEADLQRMEADNQRMSAEEQRMLAEDNEAEAQRQKIAADQNAEEAARQRDLAEYEAYVALIGLAAAKIDENAFVDARDMLNSAVCKPQLRGWEWGRLMHLCNQMVRDFDPGARVESVAFAPDGLRFATGGWNGLAIVWDAATGEEILRIPHEGLYVNGIEYSPDGKYLATASDDPAGYVRILNAETGEPVCPPWLGHEEGVLSVRFSPSGKLLLTTSYDEHAKVWDISDPTTPVEKIDLHGHNWWVWDGAFSPDEQSVVTVSQDGTAVVWSLAENTLGRRSPPFTGHRGPVYSAAYTADGKRIVTGAYDQRILIWEPEYLREFDYEALVRGETPPPPKFKALDGHAAAVRSVDTIAVGSKTLVVSGGHDNTLKLWDADAMALLETMRGHGSWVRRSVFSPDGKFVISGAYDPKNPVKLWNIEGYEEVRVLRGRVLSGHLDAIMSASFSQDGARVVTAARDRTAKIWNAANGEELVSLDEGHAFLASDARVFDNGRRLVTGAVDNTARIWNVETGVEIFSLPRTGRAAAVAVSNNDRWVLTGSDDRTAKLWDTQTGEMVRAMAGHDNEVSAVAFSNDDRLVFTGDTVGRSLLWDRETGKLIQRLRFHTSKIATAHFLPGGRWLVTASDDKTVTRWDVSGAGERNIVPDQTWILRHPDSVLSLQVSKDGKLGLTAAIDGLVRLWDLDSATVIRTLTFEKNSISSAALSPNGRRALTVHDKSNVVRLWDLDNSREILVPSETGSAGPFLDTKQVGLVWSAIFVGTGDAVLTIGGNEARLWGLGNEATIRRELMRFSPNAAVASATFSPDGERVVTASWDNSARIWNAETGVAELKLVGVHQGYVNSAQFSPDGAYVLTASDDGTARLWNATTGKVEQSYLGHSESVRNARFSRDGLRIVTASADKTARIWDTKSGRLIKVLEGHEWGILAATFSRDGRLVVTGSDDNTGRVWSVETGKLLHELRGHTAAVTSVYFSPDSGRVLTASSDFTAKLWDTLTGKEILNLKGHTQGVTSVAFSEDSRFALTGSRDGTAIVWLATDWTAPPSPGTGNGATGE